MSTVLVVACAVVIAWSVREQRIEAAECAEVERLSSAWTHPAGHGERITVVGDSYAQGWGLDNPRTSWVSQLDAQVNVEAASGAGFTRGGLCDAPDIGGLVADTDGPVVVQGGLNDVDRDHLPGEVSEVLDDPDVVALVGPAPAPGLDRAALQEVDGAMAQAAEEHGVLYVSALDWDDLPFSDGLHLTEQGHRVFGKRVALALRSPGKSG